MNRNEKLKYFEVTPRQCSGPYDSYIIKDSGTWQPVLDKIEELLDSQFSESQNEWDDIGVTVKCISMTQEQYDETVFEE